MQRDCKGRHLSAELPCADCTNSLTNLSKNSYSPLHPEIHPFDRPRLKSPLLAGVGALPRTLGRVDSSVQC